jgi:ubiquinone/menaquinone biosynthesis C-methylase UbiE
MNQRSTEGHRERKREFEVSLVRKYYSPGMRVLEFGAGSGWQAKLLQEWGCEVEAIDVTSSAQQYAHVTTYDGKTIPYGDSTFDAVFSSNTLEHVTDLKSSLAEIRRVLRENGIAVFVLPSVSWRFWTSVTAYPYLVKRIVGLVRRQPPAGSADVSSAEPADASTASRLTRAVLFPFLPHGEYASAVHELYFYGRRPWTRQFTRNGFTILEVFAGHLFYTGADLLPSLPYELRKRVSHLLGSAANIFVLRRI